MSRAAVQVTYEAIQELLAHARELPISRVLAVEDCPARGMVNIIFDSTENQHGPSTEGSGAWQHPSITSDSVRRSR